MEANTQSVTIIARSLSVDGVQLRARIVLEPAERGCRLADSAVERIDGAEVSENLRSRAVLAIVRAIAADARKAS
ncbi:hypothetical protein [Candidatus Binatus sp.]|uniref:hypothetical protein n=1 Tax=Candidatus Binatus sp. TaxID=2811406 RepID=UPI002FD9EE38